MKYEKAKAEVVLFDNSDVVTTSPTSPLVDPNVCNDVASYKADLGEDSCGGGTQAFGCFDAAQKVNE